jgi:hypothetical protein
MRVNVYAEEMTDRIEIISKQIEGQTFTGLRFYLELPVTIPGARVVQSNNAVERKAQLSEAPFGEHTNIAGPFMHYPRDDDSAAVTFWGKQDLRTVLRKALSMLDEHYASRKPGGPDFERAEVLANSILTSHGNEFYGTNEGRRALAQAFLALWAERKS